MSHHGSYQAKGFFASLFDFSFTSFVTLKFLKAIYGVLVALIATISAAALLVSFAEGATRGLLALIVVPVAALLYLVVVRISMEMIAIFFQIGEYTSLMAHSLQDGGTAGGAGGYVFGGPAGPSGPVAPTPGSTSGYVTPQI